MYFLMLQTLWNSLTPWDCREIALIEGREEFLQTMMPQQAATLTLDMVLIQQCRSKKGALRLECHQTIRARSRKTMALIQRDS